MATSNTVAVKQAAPRHKELKSFFSLSPSLFLSLSLSLSLSVCPPPGDIANGTKIEMGDRIYDADKTKTARVTYSCNRGFQLVGNKTQLCRSEPFLQFSFFFWDPVKPFCKWGKCKIVLEVSFELASGSEITFLFFYSLTSGNVNFGGLRFSNSLPVKMISIIPLTNVNNYND